LIPSWAKDEKIGYKTINTRMETIQVAPSYRSAFEKLIRLLKPFPAERLRMVEISTRVNDPKNDDPSLLGSFPGTLEPREISELIQKEEFRIQNSAR
jgi:putative SOS response-associated peptidase YedK